MPYIVQGADQAHKNLNIHNVDYSYDYPKDLDLKPDSQLHKELLSKLINRAQLSHSAISSRYSDWNHIDRLLTVYVPSTEEEKKLKEKNPNKPTTLVFPYTYAIMETIISYLIYALQSPIFRYSGMGPEDTLGAILLEKVIHLHCHRNKIILNLHTFFRDFLAYGFGAVYCYWNQEYAKKLQIKQNITQDIFGMPISTKEKTYNEQLIFEGNALTNLDPYKILPDPNVPIYKHQEGEFIGWMESTNLMSLLRDEQAENSPLFNVKYLKHVQGKLSSLITSDPSDRGLRLGTSVEKETSYSNPVDIVHLFIDLIPADWKLGDSEYPEKWSFAYAADSVIIEAAPLGLNHGLYPIAISAPDFDGYSQFPIGRLEILTGLQTVFDWLFNSHIKNVRKSMNDMFIVDPYLVNVNDLTDPEPGALIRLRRPAWGRGVQNVIQQLRVEDITRQNIPDADYVGNWMQKIAGADDAAMGALRQGGPERLTGTEFNSTRGSMYTRLERLSLIASIQGLQTIGRLFAEHTQQFMSQDTYVKVVGRWQELLVKEYGNNIQKGMIPVSKENLAVCYDILINDMSIPGKSSDTWTKLFEMLAKQPELSQQFDITKVFKKILRENGEKNADSYVRMVVQSDQNIQEQAQAGNLVPQGLSTQGGGSGSMSPLAQTLL